MSRPDIGIFTEKFRPSSLDKIILPSRVKNLFLDKEDITQHYLFYSGSPGSGKTSLCRILIQGNDSLEINVSDENGIETIRTKIKDFASNSSILNGRYLNKIIFLDEIDGASDSFYKALRGIIEQFSENVKFIATCNDINKIPEPIQSRFECIKFEPETIEEEIEIKKGIIERISKILKALKIRIEDYVLEEFVNMNFPDMRRMLNKLQYLYDSNIEEITIDDVLKNTYVHEDLYNLCISKSDPQTNYSKIVDVYRGKEDDIINSLGTSFIEWIFEKHPEKGIEIFDILNIVNEASYKRKFVIDKIVNLLDCIFKIQRVFNK